MRNSPVRMIPHGSFEDIIHGVFLNKEDTINDDKSLLT